MDVATASLVLATLLRAMLARARGLREHGFDWAVLLPDSQRAALGPFLARIPRRVGYAHAVEIARVRWPRICRSLCWGCSPAACGSP